MNIIIINANIIRLYKRRSLHHTQQRASEDNAMPSSLYFTVMSSCFWQLENENAVMLFSAKISLTT